MQESVDLNNLTEREKEAAIRGVERYRTQKRRVEQSRRVLERVIIANKMKEQGYTTQQIAEYLGVTYPTARNYMYQSDYKIERRREFIERYEDY